MCIEQNGLKSGLKQDNKVLRSFHTNLRSKHISIIHCTSANLILSCSDCELNVS